MIPKWIQIRVWLIVMVGFVSAAACFQIESFDVWHHLAAGRVITAAGEVPTHDVFLYGPERSWTDHSWAGQVLLYWIYSSAGAEGLILFRMAILSLTAGLMYTALIRRVGEAGLSVLPGSAAMAIIVLMLAAGGRFLIRPMLFSMLGTAVLFYLLDRPKRKISIFIGAAVVFLIWVQFHGGWGMGMLLVAGMAAGEWITTRHSPEKKYVGLLVLLVAMVPLVLIHPHGTAVLTYPFRLMGRQWVRTSVAEWMPMPWAMSAIPVWGILAGLISSAIIVIRSHISWRRYDLILAAGASVMMITARRNVAFWAILSAPLLAEGIALLWRKAGNLGWKTRVPLLAALFAVIAALTVHRGYFPRNRVYGMGVDEKQYPVGAANFILSLQMTGPIYNEYDAGGYLEWVLWPKNTMALDGRCLVVSESISRAQTAMAQGRAGWRKAVPDDADMMLIYWSYKAPLIELRRRWAPVYWDDKWLLLVRQQGRFEKVVRSYDQTLSAPGFMQALVGSLSPDQRETQLAMLRRRTHEDPDCAIARGLLGTALFVRGTWLTDREKPEKAKADFLAAVKAFTDDIELAPRSSRSYFGRAFANLWLGRFEPVRPDLIRAAAYDPHVPAQARDMLTNYHKTHSSPTMENPVIQWMEQWSK